METSLRRLLRGSGRLCFFAWLAVAALINPAAAQSDPAAELASLRVLDGFEVNLFASEKERVRKPIQIRFDPEGRLWVVGSVAYPQIKPGEDPDDEVVMLEDTNGDGRADRSTVFARGLHIPTGIELGDGGVYVGAATELLHLRDTDGDGKADQRRVVLRGFGTGDTHQTINSFTWGPSGELMMSQGLHAESRVETPWGIEELRQAGVWRFWPKAVRLDAFWSGAMGAHNPFGTVFDTWGQPLIFAGNGHGIYHLTQAMIRTDHFLEQRWIWNQGRKFGGAEIVENGHWPEGNQGEFISGGYLQNTVERFRITEDGATFKAERLPPLVESTNTAFRIVDVRFGPDGALYLCDWYNPVIGHYQASFRDPARDKAHGRIWRVTAKGRPLNPIPKLSSMPTPQLLRHLNSPDRWERLMANRVLADRPTAEVTNSLIPWLARKLEAEEKTLANASPPRPRETIEALGLLTRHQTPFPPLLTDAARSDRFEVRAFAARSVGHWAAQLSRSANFAGPLEYLATLAGDPHPRVRLEAIVACSYVPESRAVEIAAQALDLPGEPVLEYAFTQCVQALRPYWEPAQARGDLTFSGQANRSAAFARAAGGSTSAQYAAGRLRRVVEVALSEDTVRQLSEVVASSGGPGDLPALLNPRAFTVGTTYDAALHAQRLEEAADSSRRRGVRPDGDLARGLTPLLDNPVPAVRAAALRAAGVWKVEALRDRLEKTAQQTDASWAERQGAIEGIAALRDERAQAFLGDLAASNSPAEIRAEAIGAWAALDPELAAKAAAAWFSSPAAGPATAASLTSVFIRQRNGLAALAASLKGAPPPPEAARAIREQLARAGQHHAELDRLLAAAADASGSARAWSANDYGQLVQAVRAGANRERGAQLFQESRLACVTCHSVDGAPGKVGPDLGALGTAQSLEFILGAIIEPHKEVKEGFMAAEIVARDGVLYQGYVRGESPESLTIVDHLSGQTVRLPRETIAEQRQLGSLMPAGLVDSLSAEELRDLAAYLQGLGRK